MHIPNGEGEKPLERLQGFAGKAGAERITTTLNSEHGVLRDSQFVQDALEMMDAGLAEVGASGELVAEDGTSAKLSIRSDKLNKPARYKLQARGETLRIAEAVGVLEDIGIWKV